MNMGLLVQEVEFYLFVYLLFNKTEENQVNLATIVQGMWMSEWCTKTKLLKRMSTKHEL